MVCTVRIIVGVFFLCGIDKNHDDRSGNNWIQEIKIAEVENEKNSFIYCHEP